MIRQLKGIGLLALGLVALAGPAFAQGIIYDSNILFGNNGGGNQFDTDVGSGGNTETFVTSNFSRNQIGVDPQLESTYNDLAGPWKPTSSSPALYANQGTPWLLRASELDPFFIDTPYAGALDADPDNDWTRKWLYTNTAGGAGRTDINLALPVVTVSGNVADGTVWTSSNRYELTGRVTVPNGATLTIEPGVVVTGSPGTNAYLAVDRGGKIQAVGTAEQPIVFTSGAPLGSMAPGDWSGILINGRAVSNCNIAADGDPVDCRATNDVAGPFDCESEGNGGLFGGSNDDDDSGILRFVRSEYAGLEVSPNNELNAFTFNGVGRGTTLEFLQTFRSTDDHFEWFGGAVRSRWFVGLEGDDDGLDWQLGYRGRHQFAVITALADANASGNTGANPEKGMECDNNEDDNDCPSESDGIVANVTLIGGSTGKGTSSTGTNFRRGTNGGVVNSIVVDFTGVGFDMDSSATFANGVRGTIPSDYAPIDPSAGGITYDGNFLFNNNGGAGQFDTDAGSGGNTETFVLSNFVNNSIGVDPELEASYDAIGGPWRPTAGSPALYDNGASLLRVSEVDPFFQDVDYAGAFDAEGLDWSRNWIYFDLDGGATRDDINLALPVLTISGNVADGTVWTANARYELVGRVTVPNGATLRIQPGVVITGSPGTNAYLAVDRGGRLEAVGTADEPIIFTSGAPLGSMAPGDWSGIVINGRAVSNCNIAADGDPVDCRATNDVAGPFDCESEGNGGLFGGTDDTDDSGVLKYVRSEYAGLEVSPNNELNAFTFNGVGSGTELSYLQTFRSTDDHFEWFGGAVRSSHFVALEGDDDGLDWQLGYRGRHQFAVVTALGLGGSNPEKGMECDNNEDDNNCASASNGMVANVTLIGGSTGKGTSSTGTNFRRGTNGAVMNSIIVDFTGVAFDMDNAATFANGVGPRPNLYTGGVTTGIEDGISNQAAFAVRFGPNPFQANGNGQFFFTLGKATDVRVNIFDARGRLVDNVFEGRLEAGVQSLAWTPRDQANGVYFYKVQAGGQVASGKMMLLNR